MHKFWKLTKLPFYGRITRICILWIGWEFLKTPMRTLRSYTLYVLKTIFLKVDLRDLNKTQIWRFLPYFFCKQNRSISILKCIILLFLRLKYHLWMVRHKLTHFFYKMIQKINLKIRNGTHRFTIFIYSKSFNLTYCIK